jgi:hypothetical protein
MQAAKNVLSFHKLGYFRDDSGHSVDQLKRTAQGLPVRNQCGHDVYLSARMLNALVYLMDNGMWVGTFAICTDHHCNDGQHPKGQACDISSLGGGQQIRRGGPAGAGGVKSPRLPWTSLNHYSKNGTILAKEAMQMLHDSGLAWDLICNGVGREDATVQALQMDNGRIRGGHWWTDHTDHIHFGATTGGRN